MKALIVADLHYSLRQFDWLLRGAPEYDLVIIAGDLLDIAGHCDLDVQIVVVMKYLARIRHRAKLMVCSGNHDGDSRNEADEFIAEWLQEVREEGVHVDGETLDLSEGLVTICPWWTGRSPATRSSSCSRPRRYVRLAGGSGSITGRRTRPRSVGRASDMKAMRS